MLLSYLVNFFIMNHIGLGLVFFFFNSGAAPGIGIFNSNFSVHGKKTHFQQENLAPSVSKGALMSL